MVKCHTKPRRQGETGGIVEREGRCSGCKAKVCLKCKCRPVRHTSLLENGAKLVVQALRYGINLREEVAIKWSEYESKVYCGRCARSDEEVRV